MGYAEKMQRLCAMRGLDQTALAERVKVSKSSMSRILSGLQEPRLRLAYELARALGVSLDALMDDAVELEAVGHFVVVSDDELTILKIVRRLGVDVAIDRLLGVALPSAGGEEGAADSSANHATNAGGGRP
jgi:transcriptional regulator with XRE-family HTH domain